MKYLVILLNRAIQNIAEVSNLHFQLMSDVEKDDLVDIKSC